MFRSICRTEKDRDQHAARIRTWGLVLFRRTHCFLLLPERRNASQPFPQCVPTVTRSGHFDLALNRSLADQVYELCSVTCRHNSTRTARFPRSQCHVVWRKSDVSEEYATPSSSSFRTTRHYNTRHRWEILNSIYRLLSVYSAYMRESNTY
jgi:hypothetical protein